MGLFPKTRGSMADPIGGEFSLTRWRLRYFWLGGFGGLLPKNFIAQFFGLSWRGRSPFSSLQVQLRPRIGGRKIPDILLSPWLLSSLLVCAGADLARAHGADGLADFALAYADWLNAHLEGWCVTNRGELVPGIPRHYIRITPTDPTLPDPHPNPDDLEITLAGC